jgi:putative transposase
MDEMIRILKPATRFRWHNQLMQRKWTYSHRNAGRPQINKEIEQLVLRLARAHGWGYERIKGESLKLGYTISHETVGRFLRRHGISPAPERKSSPSWRHLTTHSKDQLLACDFFTVETLFLRTIYVLIFIEIGCRRVHFAGCTTHPDKTWVTQQVRQVMWEIDSRHPTIRFLIRDRDRKYTRAFDAVFRVQEVAVIPTPYRAPNANAFAERWIRSVREECLDKLLIINQAHLRRIMREYVVFFNTARPHQGIDQQIPIPNSTHNTNGPVRRRNVLGGIIHDYYRDAA